MTKSSGKSLRALPQRPGDQWRQSFAEWLDAGLRKQGRSVGELAKLLDVDSSKISKMRYAERRPLFHEIPRIEQYLGEKAPILEAYMAKMANVTRAFKYYKLHGVAEPGVYSTGQREPIRQQMFVSLDEEMEGVFALEMHGTSLEFGEPRAPNGSVLVCIDQAKLGAKIEPHKLYIVERTGQAGLTELSARRALVFRDRIDFCCDDPRHQPISVPQPIEASADVKVRGAVWRIIHELLDLSHFIK